MKKYETFYKLTNEDAAFLTKEDKQISAVSELNEEKARLNALIKEQERLKAKIELLEKEKRDEHAEKEQIAEIEPAKTFSVIEMLKADKLMLFLLIGFFLMAFVSTAYVNGLLDDFLDDLVTSDDSRFVVFVVFAIIGVAFIMRAVFLNFKNMKGKKLSEYIKKRNAIVGSVIFGVFFLALGYFIYNVSIVINNYVFARYVILITSIILSVILVISIFKAVLLTLRKNRNHASKYLIIGLASLSYFYVIPKIQFFSHCMMIMMLVLYVFERKAVTRLVTTVVVGVTVLSLFTIRPVIYTALINNELYYYIKYGDIHIYSSYEEYVRINSLLLLGFTFIMLIINIYQYYKQTHPKTA